jgi:hypothetical protein
MKEIEPDFCTECFKDGEVYEVDQGVYLCKDCLREWEEYEEEDRRSNPDNYCKSCFQYSEILERQKCPQCFEGDGYT